LRIKTLIRLLIIFYLILISLVALGIYALYKQDVMIDTLRESRFEIIDTLDTSNLTEEQKQLLVSTKTKIHFLRENMDFTLYIIYFLMSIATISFIFTYKILKKKILDPVHRINEVIIKYQSGAKDIEEFESNDDEIGLMIQEFFIMKKMHDDDYAEIEKLSVTDTLTEILNRRAFVEIADAAIKLSPRREKPFSLFILDIDNFKHINDTYGHLLGDEILIHFVRTVSSQIRESDVFARFGGEEFIIMLPDTLQKDAVNLAEKIRKSVETHPFSADMFKEIKITVSIGVAQLKEEKLLRDLIHRADTAVYSAKKNGRNRVEVS